MAGGQICKCRGIKPFFINQKAKNIQKSKCLLVKSPPFAPKFLNYITIEYCSLLHP